MSLARGHAIAVSVDDWRGDLTAFTADAVSVRGLTFEAAQLETSAFADDDRTFIGGLLNGATGVDGHLDATIDTGSWHVLTNVIGIVGSWRVLITALDAGTITYDFEAFFQRFSFNCPIDGLITFSADFARTAAATRT